MMLLSATSIFAQGGEFIIEVNHETATFTKQGDLIPGIHWIYPDVRAYDEVNGRMIFPGGDPIPDHLYSVDVTNGNVISSPAYPVTGDQTLSEPKFDNATGTLYGMHHDNLTSSFYLASINPVTGAYTQIGTAITGLGGMSQGMTTYDEINHRYIVLSSGTIFSIDAQTGTFTTATLGMQTGDGMINICYHNGNDTLYGLMYENTSQLFFLVWIDQSTGVVTQIGNGTTSANGNGGATIDEANRRFIFSYADQNGYHLSVMDLDNGSILFNNDISLDIDDNFHSVTYDNTRHKLFAIHWDSLIDVTGIADTHGEQAVIYPSPASDELNIRLDKNYQEMQVSVYNVNGQQVRSLYLRQASQCTMQIEDLSAGVYFLKFNAGAESFSTRFVKQ